MTSYSLNVRNIKSDNEYQQLVDYMKALDLFYYVFDDGFFYKTDREAEFKSWEPQKWKHYEGQMIIMSERFPSFTFELTCNQDERFWRIYFKDGKTELCVGDVTFEEPKKIVWDSLLVF